MLIAWGGCQNLPEDKSPETGATDADHSGLVLRISEQSRLHVAECQVHKVITHRDLLQWEASIPGLDIKRTFSVGNRKIAIPIDVELRVYIDFSNFGEEQVETSGDSIHILLPNPQIVVSSSQIDHKGIRQYADFIRNEYSDEEMNRLARHGVQSVLRDAAGTDLLRTAQANAKAILVPLITRLGYREENIRITFRELPENLLPEQLYDNERSVIKLTTK